ncbi:Os07g0197400 [Oryza sativa Japonica Group]|uniref:Os07g0197400 protein n=1 Tax=Oryza sativa subsp. japonica TaxID=39947 RepID=A0A0P0X3E4_ORYSJ|nr:hypothetical protein EE612_037687 [Oryza sativa]KAF2921824.1 hypothetical protein DAI22_07g063900 [Oryza sativa Japonica Group]BAT00483.1 Os07g0197400 [Oryza sativa Japonica Group]
MAMASGSPELGGVERPRRGGLPQYLPLPNHHCCQLFLPLPDPARSRLHRVGDFQIWSSSSWLRAASTTTATKRM